MLGKMGVVDYGIGAVAPGVFLIVRTDHPRLREAMVLRDMGDGPYYTLFRPFHLCSIEVPLTCAMLTIRRQSNMVPLDRLASEVFAVAKRDLAARATRSTPSAARPTTASSTPTRPPRRSGCCPSAWPTAPGSSRPVAMDTPITAADVEIKPSTVYSLRQLQDQWSQGVDRRCRAAGGCRSASHGLNGPQEIRRRRGHGTSHTGSHRREPRFLP